jgi:metallo-beta-lactamase family protein
MHLIRCSGRRVLLDAGLFQGLKALRLRNWGERLSEPARLDAVVLSHAHLDHCGALPLLIRQGFRGPIYCTPATAELIQTVLIDSAHLLEEDAERANRRGYSKHRPALPLYTRADAEAVFEHVVPRAYHVPFPVAGLGDVTFHFAGHILGAATVEVALAGEGHIRLLYSGDLGRPARPILRPLDPPPAADVLLLESTYGGRRHEGDPEAQLVRAVTETAARGGILLVPAFAVDRTQELLWMLRHLEREKRIPILPVYTDSPMGIEVTEIYRRHPEEFNPEMRQALAGGAQPLTPEHLHVARTPDESRAINDARGPGIIISSSGMAVGGRVLHHLSQRLGDPRNTVLLVGFQAAGTRGRSLQDGARTLRMFGVDIEVRARVEEITALSAHADSGEMLAWLAALPRPPRHVYLVHGEAEGAQALASAITGRWGWPVSVAVDGETVPLDA